MCSTSTDVAGMRQQAGKQRVEVTVLLSVKHCTSKEGGTYFASRCAWNERNCFWLTTDSRQQPIFVIMANHLCVNKTS